MFSQIKLTGYQHNECTFQNPTAKVFERAENLIQCAEMIKNKFSKTIGSSKYTTVRAERIFSTFTVENLPEGRDYFAHSRTTTEKISKVRKNSLSNRILW